MAAKKKVPEKKKARAKKAPRPKAPELPAFEPDPRSELTQLLAKPMTPVIFAPLPPSWRKQRGNAVWHGDPKCSEWPVADFTERFVPPSESHCGQE